MVHTWRRRPVQLSSPPGEGERGTPSLETLQHLGSLSQRPCHRKELTAAVAFNIWVTSCLWGVGKANHPGTLGGLGSCLWGHPAEQKNRTSRGTQHPCSRRDADTASELGIQKTPSHFPAVLPILSPVLTRCGCFLEGAKKHVPFFRHCSPWISFLSLGPFKVVVCVLDIKLTSGVKLFFFRGINTLKTIKGTHLPFRCLSPAVHLSTSEDKCKIDS